MFKRLSRVPFVSGGDGNVHMVLAWRLLLLRYGIAVQYYNDDNNFLFRYLCPVDSCCNVVFLLRVMMCLVYFIIVNVFFFFLLIFIASLIRVYRLDRPCKCDPRTRAAMFYWTVLRTVPTITRLPSHKVPNEFWTKSFHQSSFSNV